MKKKKRTIFNLFDIFICSCKNLKEDELIYIGNKYLRIMYLVNTCEYLLDEEELTYIYENNKTSTLLTIISKYNDLVIFLWLEEIKYLDQYFLIFDSWLNDGLNIIILATK